MNILISGGSGFLGTAFSEWVHENHNAQVTRITWLTRNPNQSHPDYVNMMSYHELKTTPQTFDVIINLAGAGIADKRWSEERKQTLFDSRLKPTQAIIEFIALTQQRPKLFISGSAIGWYGTQGDTPLDETSSPEPDFPHRLCDAWEGEASIATGMGVPVVVVRTGVVIHPDGGMVARLHTPFKLGVGGKLGDGTQIMSWISRADWIRAVWFIIQRHLPNATNSKAQSADSMAEVSIYNVTAPNPVSNRQFTKAMGNWLNRPTVFTLPSPMLKLMFGEMATLLIDGQKVLPKHLQESGFEFEYPTIDKALRV